MPHTYHRRSIAGLATAFDADSTDDVAEFTVPDDLTALTDDELVELADNAREAFDALDDPDNVSDDAVRVMGQIADAFDAINAEQSARAERAEAARAEAAALRDRMAPAEVAAEDDDTETDEGDEPEAEAADDTVDETETDEAPEALAASAPLNVSYKRPRKAPAAPAAKGITLQAGTELSGYKVGSRVSLAEFAAAFAQKASTINMRPSGRGEKRTVQTMSLGSVHKQFPTDLVYDGSNGDEVLTAAASPNSLTASGWCSPSETIYQLAEAAESTDGVVSLPEIQVTRGGLRHSTGPDFTTVYNATGFDYTEAEAIAGDWDGYGAGSKPCYTVVCPDYVDDRLDIDGICIRASLLTARANPEVVESVVRQSLVAHERKQSERKLAAIVAASTAVAGLADPVGGAAPTLRLVELQAEHYRQTNAIADNRRLEVVVPKWMRAAFRADISARSGTAQFDVTNEQIDAWFTARNLSVQYVYGLSDLPAAATTNNYPTEAVILIYLAGTWVAGTNAVVNLEAVYDSALLGDNEYTALFTEEGWLVAQRFHDSRAITLDLCLNGATSLAVAADCDSTQSA